MSYMSATFVLLAFTTSLSAKWSDCDRLIGLPLDSPEPVDAPDTLLHQSFPPLLPFDDRLPFLLPPRLLPRLERLDRKSVV